MISKHRRQSIQPGFCRGGKDNLGLLDVFRPLSFLLGKRDGLAHMEISFQLWVSHRTGVNRQLHMKVKCFM
jgi:hypothetical protein